MSSESLSGNDYDTNTTNNTNNAFSNSIDRNKNSQASSLANAVSSESSSAAESFILIDSDSEDIVVSHTTTTSFNNSTDTDTDTDTDIDDYHHSTSLLSQTHSPKLQRNNSREDNMTILSMKNEDEYHLAREYSPSTTITILPTFMPSPLSSHRNPFVNNNKDSMEFHEGIEMERLLPAEDLKSDEPANKTHQRLLSLSCDSSPALSSLQRVSNPIVSALRKERFREKSRRVSWSDINGKNLTEVFEVEKYDRKPLREESNPFKDNMAGVAAAAFCVLLLLTSLIVGFLKLLGVI